MTFKITAEEKRMILRRRTIARDKRLDGFSKGASLAEGKIEEFSYYDEWVTSAKKLVRLINRKAEKGDYVATIKGTSDRQYVKLPTSGGPRGKFIIFGVWDIDDPSTMEGGGWLISKLRF